LTHKRVNSETSFFNEQGISCYSVVFVLKESPYEPDFHLKKGVFIFFIWQSKRTLLCCVITNKSKSLEDRIKKEEKESERDERDREKERKRERRKR
jgi:hypothetical protein